MNIKKKKEKINGMLYSQTQRQICHIAQICPNKQLVITLNELN